MTVPTHIVSDLEDATLRRRRTLKWTTHDDTVLPLWVAEMDFPTAPPILHALRDTVGEETLGYPPREERSGLREATAEWIERTFGWSVDPHRVHTLPDVVRGIHLALDTYSQPGSTVVVPVPAYHPFFEVVRTIGRSRVDVPMAWDGARHVLDFDAIDEALRPGGRTLILCNPHNPLGRALTRVELVQLSRIVERHGARVVSDEIHAPLTHPGYPHVPYASVSREAADHTITLMSASKGWNLAGLNCAQVILSNDADEERWQEVSALYTHGASTMGIRATIAAYRDGGPWLESVRTRLAENQRTLGDLLQQHLPEVGHRRAEATYFGWLDCRALALDEPPAEFFLRHAGVALSDGERFGTDFRDFVRLNFAASHSVLERAVKSMGEAARATAPRTDR